MKAFSLLLVAALTGCASEAAFIDACEDRCRRDASCGLIDEARCVGRCPEEYREAASWQCRNATMDYYNCVEALPNCAWSAVEWCSDETDVMLEDC